MRFTDSQHLFPGERRGQEQHKTRFTTNNMGSSASTLSDVVFKSLLKDMTVETKGLIIAEIVKKCNEILIDNPGNRCAKYAAEYLSSEEGKSLSNEGESKQVTQRR